MIDFFVTFEVSGFLSQTDLINLNKSDLFSYSVISLVWVQPQGPFLRRTSRIGAWSPSLLNRRHLSWSDNLTNGFSYHCYADDALFYLSFPLEDPTVLAQIPTKMVFCKHAWNLCKLSKIQRPSINASICFFTTLNWLLLVSSCSFFIHLQNGQ